MGVAGIQVGVVETQVGVVETQEDVVGTQVDVIGHLMDTVHGIVLVGVDSNMNSGCCRDHEDTKIELYF